MPFHAGNRPSKNIRFTDRDPFFNQTTLLLNGNGTNGAQNNTFLDSSPNNFTITRNGNTTQGTFTPFSVPEGQWSNYFDGTGDYLTIPDNAALELGSVDFTMECWVNFSALPPSNGNQATFFNKWAASQASYEYYLYNDAGTYKLYLTYSTNGTNATNVGNITWNPVIGTWYHLALSRSGNNLRFFVDGTQQGTTQTLSATIFDSTAVLAIGIFNTTTPSGAFNGYMSNARIVKGSAVYTSNFTPPTSPLTAITNTSLLTCQSNRFRDNSTNNFTITRNGDVAVRPFSSFAPTAEYSASTNGGSVYLDGTGDFLNTSTSGNLSLPSNSDWTIELLFYLDNLSAIQCLYFNSAGSSNSWQTNHNFAAYILTNGTFTLEYSNGTVTPLSSTGTLAAAARSWNHLAMVYNGSAKTMTTYLNGVVDISAANWSAYAPPSATPRVTIARTDSIVSTPTYFVNGYVSNLRQVNGNRVYTSNFTPPTTPITPVTNTSLLLNFTNAGIYDLATKNVLETVGNAQVNTAIRQYGTGSLSFDGSGDQLLGTTNPDLVFGTDDFTIEAWVYQTQRNTLSDIVSCHNYGVAADWLWSINSSGNLFFQISSSGTGAQTSSSTVSLNTWTHVTVTRQNGTVRQFINGSQVSSATYITSITNTIRLSIGSATNLNAASTFYGFIDDLRITKGVARYTANFTPPTRAFFRR